MTTIAMTIAAMTPPTMAPDTVGNSIWKKTTVIIAEINNKLNRMKLDVTRNYQHS